MVSVADVANDLKEAVNAVREQKVSDVLKDPNTQDVLKNPSPDAVKKAIEKIKSTDDPEPTDAKVVGEADRRFRARSKTSWVFVFVVMLAFGGGVYTFRRLTQPGPIGLPIL